MNTDLQKLNLNALNEALKERTLAQRIQLILEQGFTAPMFSSSLGQEDQVLTDCIATNKFPISIFTLDTQRLFRETEDLIDATESRYDLSIDRVYPDAESVAQLEAEKGMFSFYNSVSERVECCEIRKVEPLKRALKTADLWLTGLRSDQSQNRNDITFIAYDERFSVYKFNPMVDYSLEQVNETIKRNDIPQNPLHALGYLSIGCRPCTRAVYPEEDIRAGRWWWEQSKKECGLHR